MNENEIVANNAAIVPNSEFSIQKDESQQDLSIKCPPEKQKGWLKLADSFYNAESDLNLAAQRAMAEYSLPMSISDIPESEKILKNIISARVGIEERRKKITSKFRDLSDRLMIPEKSLIEPIDILTKEIIKFKKEDEIIRKKETEKIEQKKRFIEEIIKTNAETDAKLKLFVSELLSRAFSFAIEKRILPSEINEYVKKCSQSGVKKIMEFKIPTIDGSKYLLIPQDDKNEILSSNNYTAIDIANTFDYEIKHKFADYEVSFANAKQAILNESNNRATEEAKIEQEKMTKQISASIQANSVPIDAVVLPKTKALKKVYKIEMSDSFETMVMIFSAFISHKEKCLEKTTAKKWSAFTASSAMLCLEKVKNDDNLFSPSGIIFVEVDKL